MQNASSGASPHTSRPSPAAVSSAGRSGANSRLARLPVLLIVAFFGFLLLPRVQQDAHVTWAFAGVGTGMLLWQVALWRIAARAGRPLLVEFVPPVRQHYIQACVQSCLYAYWGWFWSPIYAQVPLILGQFVFIFAFDALFAWSRGRCWRLTSGPVPIVLSTNLFIWFVDQWFVLQFAMITVGLLGKEFLKWRKDGRTTHIFNPSGFGLFVTALALIATGTTDELTMARPLATTIDGPPHIFLVLFCLGLVVQHFFAVTLMTFAAAVVVVGLNLGYTWATGVYMFVGSNLPAAGFLGLHLLMTDPSTSPRTNLGRTLFGAGYGLGYVVMYDQLGLWLDLELFAKLFPVPILNLAVRRLDRIARSGWAGRLNQRWESALTPRRLNLLHMSMWSLVFFTLLSTHYLPGPNAGNSIAFWKRARAEGKPQADRKLKILAKSQALRMAGKDSGEAANEFGIVITQTHVPSERVDAVSWFGLGASLESTHASQNLLIDFLFLGAAPSAPDLEFAWNRVKQDAAAATRETSAFLLGYAHETGRSVPQDLGRALKLYRECGPAHAFAQKGIARMALGPAGQLFDLDGVEAVLAKEAAAGDAESCWYLAYLYAGGRGAARDEQKAHAMLERACKLGLPRACEALGAPSLPPFVPPGPKELTRPPWATAFPL